jgi:hypothetical protein
VQQGTTGSESVDVMFLTWFVAKQILALAVEMVTLIVHLTECALAKSRSAQIASDVRATMAVRCDDCERLTAKGGLSGPGGQVGWSGCTAATSALVAP